MRSIVHPSVVRQFRQTSKIQVIPNAASLLLGVHIRIFAETATMSTPTKSPAPLSYRDAGVDIEAGDQLVENIKPFAKRTMRPEVMGGIGGFGALVEVSKKFKEPVMVSGTDGVGTKLRLAQLTHRHDTIGIDLVAMSVNDILVSGAEPIFFLDYYVCEKLNVEVATAVVKGIAAGCEQAGCALIGGETAEHPGTFPVDEYDLAGFALGLVEKSEIITGKDIAPGDVVLGLASSGPHSNGFSLIRRILDRSGIDPNDAVNKTLIDQLLAPTRIYVKPVLALMKTLKVKGLAHITGGGLTENVPRVLSESLTAVMRRDAWPMPDVFKWLQDHGNVADAEMARTFNCGIGMVLIVAPADADKAAAFLREQGETVYRIGEIRNRAVGEHGASVI
jgi:phosphoribosylformylglycinamidine cyclo-ligase